METAISSQPSSRHLSAPQSSVKPCQRSCRGLMFYLPPSGQLEEKVAKEDQSTSWRSKEPICLGLSAARYGPNLDLQKLHEAREIPAGQHVDFSVVIGHAVFQSNNSETKVLPPGCMSGLEFMRFCKTSIGTDAPLPSSSAVATSGSASSVSDSGCNTGTSSTTAPATPILVHAIKAVTGSLKGFASSFKILTSSADTNARLNKTWSSIIDFDPQQFADKFETQTFKNMDSMTKWLRDLQDAVFKPRA